jgi:hypothetical protein
MIDLESYFNLVQVLCDSSVGIALGYGLDD